MLLSELAIGTKFTFVPAYKKRKEGKYVAMKTERTFDKNGYPQDAVIIEGVFTPTTGIFTPGRTLYCGDLEKVSVNVL